MEVSCQLRAPTSSHPEERDSVPTEDAASRKPRMFSNLGRYYIDNVRAFVFVACLKTMPLRSAVFHIKYEHTLYLHSIFFLFVSGKFTIRGSVLFVVWVACVVEGAYRLSCWQVSWYIVQGLADLCCHSDTSSPESGINVKWFILVQGMHCVRDAGWHR